MAERNQVSLGLTGWPLERSLSPVIHSTFLKWADIPGEYRLNPFRPEELASGMRLLREEGYTGLNVTYPHKAAAAQLCDKLILDAEELGMVNTISWQDGLMIGRNTDTIGFDRMLCGVRLGNQVLLVGSGGAARAVDLVLSRMGVRCTVFCRRPAEWTGLSPSRGLDDLGSSARELDSGTVVNATTLGWRDDDSFPLEMAHMRDLSFIDLNYNPSWEWRNRLDGTASSIYTGETMLVFQAAESFTVWTGLTPPVVEAFLAVRPALEDNGAEG